MYFKSSRSNGQRLLEIRYIPSSTVNGNTQTMPLEDDEKSEPTKGDSWLSALPTVTKVPYRTELLRCANLPFLAFLHKARYRHERAYNSRLMPWQAERRAIRQSHNIGRTRNPLGRDRANGDTLPQPAKAQLCHHTLSRGAEKIRTATDPLSRPTPHLRVALSGEEYQYENHSSVARAQQHEHHGRHLFAPQCQRQMRSRQSHRKRAQHQY